MGNAVVTPKRFHEIEADQVMRTFRIAASSSYAAGGDVIVAADIKELMGQVNDLTKAEMLEAQPGYLKTTVTGVNAVNSATVNVAATASFPASGSFFLFGLPVTYTGKTGTSFTGCGNHAVTVGGEVVAGLKAYTLLFDADNKRVRIYDGSAEVAAATDLSQLVADCIIRYEDVHGFDGGWQ